MRVYNLTALPVDFRGKNIPPNGGFLDYPEIKGYLPDRDRDLERKKILSFGDLPIWWRLQQAQAHFRTDPKKMSEPLPMEVPEPIIAEPQPATFETPSAPTGWVEKPITKKTFGRK